MSHCSRRNSTVTVTLEELKWRYMPSIGRSTNESSTNSIALRAWLTTHKCVECGIWVVISRVRTVLLIVCVCDSNVSSLLLPPLPVCFRQLILSTFVFIGRCLYRFHTHTQHTLYAYRTDSDWRNNYVIQYLICALLLFYFIYFYYEFQWHCDFFFISENKPPDPILCHCRVIKQQAKAKQITNIWIAD